MDFSKRRLIGLGMTGLVVLGTAAAAWGASHSPPVLPVDTSDVAVLPPAGPHRVFTLGLIPDTYISAGADVIDADSDKLSVLGQVPVGGEGLIAVSRDANRVYTIETFYRHGNRGPREDVLSIYDGRTLSLLKEILIPERMLAGYLPSLFDTSVDGKLAYVDGGAGMHVIDLDKGKLLTTVAMPGCTSTFPVGARDFGIICGDGTLGTVHVPEAGDARAVFSKPFFDADHDPLYAEAGNDRTTGEAWFISFTGQVWPVKFGTSPVTGPVIGKSWSLNSAASLPAAGTGVQELAWRPGGYNKVIAYHRATRQLYVLMHQGKFWTHKAPGTEVWVLDTQHQKLIKRIPLGTPASALLVSQDAKPQLYTISQDPHEFAVYDATTGQLLRKRALSATLMFAPGY